MYYINACSTISNQLSLKNNDWVSNIELLATNSELIVPDYKQFIDASDLRRMSKIIRMGIVCCKDCLEQSGINNPDAIIIGTGLGCLTDTEKFLKNTLTIEGLIPPTSFIQSTHNTIAGQISLALKNHKYNNTHTQNSLSFEHALLDAILCLSEGLTDVLVGAADEKISLLDELVEEFGYENFKNKLTEGASFFMVSNIKNKSSKAQLIDCITIGLNRANPKTIIEDFLVNHNLTLENIDLILFASNGTIDNNEVINDLKPVVVLSFENYCGYYNTNIAFGMHMAVDMLNGEGNKLINNSKPLKHILLYNNLLNNSIGLTLIKSIEA